MSALYPDLARTTFPSSEQAFPVMLDIVAADGRNVKGFQEAMMAGNTDLARVYYDLIESADQKFVTAEMLNTLFQTCVAVQRFYKTDVQPYVTSKQQEWQLIIDQMGYKAAFDVNTQYKKNNYVVYNNLIYIATADPPLGTYPNNTTYWRQMTIKGQQGASGVGMAFSGDWEASQNYTEQDVVIYGSALWGATAASVNQIPSEGSAYWRLIFRNSPQIYPVQSATPVGQAVGDLWFEVVG